LALPPTPSPTEKQQQHEQQHAPGKFFSVSSIGAERSSMTRIVSSIFFIVLFNEIVIAYSLLAFQLFAKINLLQM